MQKLLIALLLVPLTALADEETVGGVTWTYIVRDGQAEVGTGMNRAATPQSTVGAITIPSVLGTYPVTRIGDWAFFGCSGLTSVKMSSGVSSIGNSAFYGCVGLASVTLPDEVTNMGDEAFYGCTGLASVSVSSSLKSIGRCAFCNCCGLT